MFVYLGTAMSQQFIRNHPKVLFFGAGASPEFIEATADSLWANSGFSGFFLNGVVDWTYSSSEISSQYGRLKPIIDTLKKYSLTENFIETSLSLPGFPAVNDTASLTKVIDAYGNIAQLADSTGCKGVGIDLEDYNKVLLWSSADSLWTYRIGRDIALAMKAKFPNIVTLIVGENSLVNAIDSATIGGPASSYGFTKGVCSVLNGSNNGVHIMDENTYEVRNVTRFFGLPMDQVVAAIDSLQTRYMEVISGKLNPGNGYPAAEPIPEWNSNCSIDFGALPIWVIGSSVIQEYSIDDFANQMEAFTIAPKYVWVFSVGPAWWSAPGIIPAPNIGEYWGIVKSFYSTQVAYVYPKQNSINVPINSEFTLFFSRLMNTSSVESHLNITPFFAHNVAWDNHKLFITPQSPLSPNTTYTIRIDGTALDASGDSLDGNGDGIAEGSPTDDFTLNFTTGSTVQLPQVIEMVPSQGLMGVATNAQIYFDFNNMMNKNSIDSSFSISPSDGGGYWTNIGNSYSYNSFVGFQPGTFYTVTLKSKYAKDIWGYPLDGNADGISDSSDDYHLYFATAGKGKIPFYTLLGNFPLNFDGLPVGTVQTAQVTLPDTVNITQHKTAQIRLVVEGVTDTTALTIKVNGQGMIALPADAIVAGGNAELFDISFPTSYLKIGQNVITFLLNKTTSRLRIIPMALFLELVTGIRQGKIIGAVPKEFILYQNYPNPFNPVTQIRYNLPEEATVTLNIYNAMGQEVKRLINGRYENAGSYMVHWDGKNNDGRVVTSGIYFYRIQTDQYIAVRKMLLLK